MFYRARGFKMDEAVGYLVYFGLCFIVAITIKTIIYFVLDVITGAKDES
jgi:hypothetical protein